LSPDVDDNRHQRSGDEAEAAPRNQIKRDDRGGDELRERQRDVAHAPERHEPEQRGRAHDDAGNAEHVAHLVAERAVVTPVLVEPGLHGGADAEHRSTPQGYAETRLVPAVERR
jgi:hypothetical protein